MLSLAGLVAIAVGAPAFAVTHEYTIEIPDRVPVKYRLDLPIQHPGEVTIEAVWSGTRVISLRLDSPDGRSLQRAGPSPQWLAADVEARSVEAGPWTLTVHSMPTTGFGQGTLTVTLPDPPQPVAPASPPDEAESREAEPPWPRMRPYPGDLPASWLRLFETIERFASLVIYDTGGSPPDACRWHTDLLEYLAEQRDRLVSGQIYPAEPTLKLLYSLSAAIQQVEELRTTTDSVISGPPPADEELRAAWIRLRRDRLQALEAELDDLLGSVHRGHAPELAKLEWPARMISCLIACQRHFEERVRVGERNAINRELAQTQWDKMLTAGEALRDLSAVNTRIARTYSNAE